MNVSRHWREQIRRYRLVGSKCTDCGRLSFPNRAVCPKCNSRNNENYQYVGRGKIISFTNINSPPKEHKYNLPFAVALIQLMEGPVITAQITDARAEELEIGMEVEMVTRKIMEYNDDGIICYGYKFRPIVEYAHP